MFASIGSICAHKSDIHLEEASVDPIHVANPIIDWFYEQLIYRLMTEPPFCWGFSWGLIVALILGLIGRFYLWFRGAWRRFFKPGKGPATVDTPSGLANMIGCARAVVVLILLLGGIIFVFLLADLPFFS